MCVCTCNVDVFQQECLCGWIAHHGEVYNVQFSSDETSVYSMGSDSTFCQWSINQSGRKVRSLLESVHALVSWGDNLVRRVYVCVCRWLSLRWTRVHVILLEAGHRYQAGSTTPAHRVETSLPLRVRTALF